MNKIKAVLWLIIIGFILLLFFQNQSFFLEGSQSININLILIKYQTPELSVSIFFLAFFVMGLLISYFFNLPERFRLRKTIKNLKATIDSQDKEIVRIRTSPKPAGENDTPDHS